MFGASSGNFNRLVEKATSQLLLEPDWDSTLQICDCIRQGDVQPKTALVTLRKKISQDNPHVSLYALQVIESCVKNCGAVVHEEVATKEFMEYFKDLAKKRPDPVKAKILELVQVWAHAFRNSPNYKVVQDTYHLMKMEGYGFPALKESDAMFKAEMAPEWKDGECCHRCRVTFSTFQRKHHCRHCGEIFCSKCSCKTSIIPKFGIEREVRVCEACFDEVSVNLEGKKSEDGLPQEYLNSPLAKQAQSPPSKTEQEVQEEEDLQLALALSKSEADAKAKEEKRNKMRLDYGSSSVKNTNSEQVYAQPNKVVEAPVLDTSDMDPALARYLNRKVWEKKNEELKTSTTQPSASTTQPSAPVAVAEAKVSTGNSTEGPDLIEERYQNGETSTEQEEFLHALRSSVEIFVNRMKSNSARGRSIATDSSVQTLFMTINAMHPQLMKYLSEMEDSRSHYETLQDKLAQLKDAREALDALRDEHRDKRRREQEELERQRQIQMAHKLDILRQKKQEYLEYQRQMAMQRLQEQEREMQMRFEQQKQLTHMRAMQYQQPYQMYPQQPQTFSPGGSAEGSPLHQGQQVGAQGAYPQGPGGMVGAPGAPGVQGGPLPPPGALPAQPQYPQAGFQGAPQQVPGGYQPMPPAGGYQGSMYQGAQGQYPTPPTSQPQMGQPMGQSAAGPGQGPPQGDYQSFNMHNVGNALPNQGQSGPPGGVVSQQLPSQPLPGHQLPEQPLPGQQLPGQQLPGHQMPGQQLPGHQMPGQQLPGHQMPGQQLSGHQMPGQQIPGQQFIPPSQGQYLPPGAQPIPQQQGPPQLQGPPAPPSHEAQLICFD